jgi:hypothetical protein
VRFSSSLPVGAEKGADKLQAGEWLFENLRFHSEEEGDVAFIKN